MKSAKIILVGLAVLTVISFTQPVLAEGQDFSDSWTYEGDGKLLLSDGGRISGNEAVVYRTYIDSTYGDSDGILTQAEVDLYVEAQITMGIHGQTNLFRLDGKTGGIETISMAFENITGPVNSTAVFTNRAETRFHFDVKDTGTKQFWFTYDTIYSGDQYSNFTFKVPPGWEITDVQNLEDAQISGDNATVEGLAPLDTQIEITFRELGGGDITGIAIIAVAAIAAAGIAVCILKKR